MTITPVEVKYAIDIITLLIGLYITVKLIRSGIGGTVGFAFKIILLGILVLAFNHLLDTAYLADAMKAAGHTSDFMQSSLLHRAINFVGFVLMAIGFQQLIKTPK